MLHRRRGDPVATAATTAVSASPLSARKWHSTTRRGLGSIIATEDHQDRRILSPPLPMYASSTGKVKRGVSPVIFCSSFAQIPRPFSGELALPLKMLNAR